MNFIKSNIQGRVASKDRRTILSGVTMSMCLIGNMVSNGLTVGLKKKLEVLKIFSRF